HRADQVVAGEAWGRPAGQLLQQVAVEDDRNREDQAQPELAAEDRRMVGVPAMCTVTAVMVHGPPPLHHSLPPALPGQAPKVRRRNGTDSVRKCRGQTTEG